MANALSKKNTNVSNINRQQADAWFNVSIALKSGDKQIGGIPLYLNKDLHAFLIENKDTIEKATLMVDINVMSDEPANFEFV